MPSKANEANSGILPHSPWRTVDSLEFREKSEEIRKQILLELEAEMQRASFVKRCWLKWRAQRRIRLEIRKISPSDYAL
jgi:hypothetical protein